jgi:hypothetical protein
VNVNHITGRGHKHARWRPWRADGFRARHFDLHDKIDPISACALENFTHDAVDYKDRVISRRGLSILCVDGLGNACQR